MHVQHASKILYKELLITDSDIEGLGAEQKAAIDWLVLMYAKKVVGFKRSTFSLQLQAYRDLDHVGQDSTMLLNPWSRSNLEENFTECFR